MQVLSLCSGGGGLDLGFRLAVPASRWVCYVEREAAAIALLVAHMQDGSLDDAPCWSDLRTFDGRPWRGLVDAVVGGIPCQPWSVAGKRRGVGDERNLWPDTIRIIRECGPGVVFIENVAGILRDGYHGIIKPDLERAGYRVAADIFTAAEVGAPHRRERLFILGVGHSDSEGRSRRHSGFDLDPRAIEASSTAMGDSERRRCRERTDTPEPERETQAWRQAVTGGRGTVGDANGQGPQGRGRSERGGAYELPAWPPGPAERDRWAAILARYPDLAPATTESPVRDVADGLASGLARRDRLSILGNGVVPAQAAYAYWMLSRKLGVRP